ncbi:hypothetical protein E2C01_093171 [Portunus trituberculatus]|uniref:Uncharacterized protein n=1 Tax=Portunus trituberculatus TaxID=210409 RepID=A0A5B7JTA6_PORTR|nr:hypothetical protein [Portunus trituberculatus]
MGQNLMPPILPTPLRILARSIKTANSSSSPFGVPSAPPPLSPCSTPIPTPPFAFPITARLASSNCPTDAVSQPASMSQVVWMNPDADPSHRGDDIILQ